MASYLSISMDWEQYVDEHECRECYRYDKGHCMAIEGYRAGGPIDYSKEGTEVDGHEWMCEEGIPMEKAHCFD